MKILFIAPRFPLPANTGAKIRTLNILRQVARTCIIDLVCFSFDEVDEQYTRSLQSEGIRTHLVKAEELSLAGKGRLFLLDERPVSIAKYDLHVMAQKLRSLVETNHYDVAHIDHLHMAGYHSCLHGIPCVVDEHNVEYKILERYAFLETKVIKKMLIASQVKKMRRYESETIGLFNRCLAVSEDDRETFMGLTSNRAKVEVIANGVDTKYFHMKDLKVRNEALKDLKSPQLVFTGSMDWLPNEDAVVYFCQKILPRIWDIQSDIVFTIVGKSPSLRVRQLGDSDQRIVVTGMVDDVRSFVAAADVFVVPMRVGGGTRLKILEAMSMERAVVSTSIGAEGIEYTRDQDIVLADRPDDFARAVIRVLEQPEKIKMLGEAGRRLVLEKYDWPIIGRKVLGIYDDIKKETN